MWTHLILLRHARKRGFQLGDPAQSRGEQMFKGSNLVHSTTDSEKSSQRHEIQTKTENSCAKWPRRITSKLTKTRYWMGCLGVTITLEIMPANHVGKVMLI
jgi:hypothetical protein